MPGNTISGTYPSFTISADLYALTNLGTIGGGAVSVGLTVTGGEDTLVNGGMVAGTTYGVAASQGLNVTNQSAGAISGASQGVLIQGDPGMVTNAGRIGGGVLLGAGGVVSNQTGASISQTGPGASDPNEAAVAVLGQTGAVDNSGLINGFDRGIYLGAGGTVTNRTGASVLGTSIYGIEIAGASGTLSNAGSIGGLDAGVLFVAGGTISNQSGGIIIGTGVNSEGVEFGATVGVLDNAGSIAGGQSGVFLAAGGVFTNRSGGTISQSGGVLSGFNYSGVEIGGATGTVTNTGFISGQYNGVALAAGGTVVNQTGGTISSTTGIGVNIKSGTLINDGGVTGGLTAVQFASGFAERLVIDSGATFGGKVDGGNTIGATAISTLELSGMASEGTLTGFGTQYTNFAQLTVDQGASWALTSTDTFAAGTTLTDRGTLLANGATAASAGPVEIDGAAGGPASMSVANGGFWSGTSAFLIGSTGIGVLSINAVGTVGAAGIDVAQASGASGSITVSGTNSLLTNAGQFVVGDSGQGNLTIQGGATVVTTPGTVAGLAGLVVANADSSGGSSINVSGTGSNLQVTGLLDVGVSGSGALSVSNGASVTAGSLDAGNIASAVANISVTDASFTVTGNATVADDGTGVLSVLSGATFAAANLTIGSQGDSSGAVVVSGTNSVVNIAGNLNVGTSLGTGDLTIGPGGVVNAKVVSLQGQVVLENGELDPTVNLINQGQTAGGSGTIAAGDIVDEGVIQAGGSKPSQKLLVVNGTVLGDGPWTINGTAQAQANGGAGILQINAGGTLELNGAVLNAPSMTFTDDVTPQSTYTVTNSVVDVNFADATGVLKLDQIVGFAGTIVAFQKGDSFVITGGTLSGLGLSNGNTLTVSDSGHGGTDSLIFASGVSAAGFSIVNNNTIQVACFAAGTRIGAEKGCVPVEDLRVGNRVVTADGRVEPIVWVGQRTVNCARHPKPETVWPVRVSAGALGGRIPVRDLYLSPDHAVFVNNVLVPVKLLINGTSITQVKQSTATYYHVELPRHEVIRAEGLTVESYLNLGDRANFQSDSETIRLFPDFSARFALDAATAWETKAAAPLVIAGDALAAAQTAATMSLQKTGCRFEGIAAQFW